MADSLHQDGEFNGLSYRKIVDILTQNKFSLREEAVAVPYFPTYYSEIDQAWVTGPQEGYKVESLSDRWDGQVGPVPIELVDNVDSVLHILPDKMVGALFTDGANMVVLGHFPDSDEIKFSRSWYHALDTSAGYVLGEMIVKGIIGSATFGLSNIALSAFQAGSTKPPAPIDPTPPEEAKPYLQPDGATVLEPINPSPEPPVQNPVEIITGGNGGANEPPPVTQQYAFPWKLLLAGAALFVIS